VQGYVRLLCKQGYLLHLQPPLLLHQFQVVLLQAIPVDEALSQRRESSSKNRNPLDLSAWGGSAIQKKECHIKTIRWVHKILPVRQTTLEVAQCDMQKICHPGIEGKEYQEGPQLRFWNVREYVLARDGHTCQWCQGKSMKTGGDRPDNLMTLCEMCHDHLHRTHLTFGYLTKHTRITHELEKSHLMDARCISQHPLAGLDGTWYLIKQVRRNNRHLHCTKRASEKRERDSGTPRRSMSMAFVSLTA
jgi:RRXRR protein